ncbi:unnamed protein product [Ceratitis capitata]|uniref:(Mediterranean fruit fly) hypothetical protein n=1 Tax=Ceratitis capitata TaxID=7213 RepID=A0A811UR77_CERCA|nr:unnamed protein product [Ceratitis capitata]
MRHENCMAEEKLIRIYHNFFREYQHFISADEGQAGVYRYSHCGELRRKAGRSKTVVKPHLYREEEHGPEPRGGDESRTPIRATNDRPSTEITGKKVNHRMIAVRIRRGATRYFHHFQEVEFRTNRTHQQHLGKRRAGFWPE